MDTFGNLDLKNLELSYKQRLRSHSSRSVGDQNTNRIDAQWWVLVSAGHWAAVHSCHYPVSNCTILCPHPENINESEWKYNRLIWLVEEISRQSSSLFFVSTVRESNCKSRAEKERNLMVFYCAKVWAKALFLPDDALAIVRTQL